MYQSYNMTTLNYINLCLFCCNLLFKTTQSGFVRSWKISNKTMSNSNVHMQGFHSTVNPDCIYIFGGQSDNGFLNCFNTSDQSWTLSYLVRQFYFV